MRCLQHEAALALGAGVASAAIARRRHCGSWLGQRTAARGVATEAALPTGLTLVDGNACLHAAFYGTSNAGLTNLDGQPTGAVFTFMQSLRRLQRDLRSSHFAVMMDERLEKVERKLEYPEYKGNRKECPKDLALQFAKAREACDALGVPWRSAVGWEADDLIATFTWEASKDCDVHIISSDKDLTQLVNSRVWLHNHPRNMANAMDCQGVKKRWGVEPHQMGDLLALSGDSADNLPGVPGIGPKKAAALIQRHGTLQQILGAAQAGSIDVPGIGPRLLLNLQQYAEQASQMHELVKLRVVPNLDAAAFRTDFLLAERNQQWLDRAREFCLQENMQKLARELSAEYEAAQSDVVGQVSVAH